MSSVDMETTCPKCGFQEANHMWSSRGYEQTFCYQCGYFHEQDYESGKTETSGGFGSFKITYHNGVSRGGGLTKPATLAELKRGFRGAMRSLHVKGIEFSLPVNGVWVRVVVKDFPESRPKTFRNKKKVNQAQAWPAGTPRPAPTYEEMADDVPF